jgi:hypothetical protein
MLGFLTYTVNLTLIFRKKHLCSTFRDLITFALSYSVFYKSMAKLFVPIVLEGYGK